MVMLNLISGADTDERLNAVTFLLLFRNKPWYKEELALLTQSLGKPKPISRDINK